MGNYSEVRRVSRLWYFVPIIFGILGGLASYFLVRDRDKKFASKLLMIGVIRDILMIVTYAVLTLFFWSFPLIQKQSEVSASKNIYNLAFQVEKSIEAAIDTGEKQSLLTQPGIMWIVDNLSNSLILTTRSRITDISPTADWIKISEGKETILYGRSTPINNEFEIQYKIQIMQPFVLEGNKLSSSMVKKVEIFKENKKILISLIE
jgi:hypothetical protein